MPTCVNDGHMVYRERTGKDDALPAMKVRRGKEATWPRSGYRRGEEDIG